MEQAVGNGSRTLGFEGMRASPAGSIHAIDFGGAGGECVVLHVTDPRLAISVDRSGLFMDGAGASLSRLAKAADAGDLVGLWLHSREALSVIERWLYRPEPNGPPEWLLDARRQIVERGQRITAGMSMEHVSRSFRKYYGITPSEARRAAMLSHSLKLLRQDDIALVDVALEAGFAHQSHLTNVMRRTLGVTPAGYRQMFLP